MTWDPWGREVKDVAAAVARIRLWLEQHPQTISVGSEIGRSDGFQSAEWPFRSYAVDRRDLEAVLNAIDGKGRSERAE